MDQVKKVLNSKKGDSLQKLKALTLLHYCLVDGKNPELIMYAEKKILNKLQSLSRFKKVSRRSLTSSLFIFRNRNQRTHTEVHCSLARTAIKISQHCSSSTFSSTFENGLKNSPATAL